MSDIEYAAYKYSHLLAIIFGILGSILVISILKQKIVLRKNHYFLVLQLAICDFGALTIFFLDHTFLYLLKGRIIIRTKLYILGYYLSYFFQVAGIGMMLMISVLRYRATMHPLKPAISRRKLKIFCGLVYIVGFVAGYGPALPLGFLPWNDVRTVYIKYLYSYIIICFLFLPTIFMAVVYFKVGRVLVEQNKYIKSVCSNPAVTQSASSASINSLTYFRSRKAFLVCLLIVICFTVENIVLTGYLIWTIAGEFHLTRKYHWCRFVEVALWHSANPLIYGILDKTLLKFWKRCRSRKRRSPEH